MTRGSSSSSSQVGLFSTQISEQIVRLRALAKSQDGPSEAHQVDLRRAVMATRLLAGSARILQLELLQRFLDELLTWLQVVQSGGRPLTTTQALILDSVIELEEALMVHLDESGRKPDAELGTFEPQIDDLLTLIHHNLAKSGPLPEEPRLDPAVLDRSAGMSTVAIEGPEALETAVQWFSGAAAAADDEPARDALLTRLEGPLERLIEVRAGLLQRATQQRIEELPLVADGLDAVEDPAGDAVFGPAVSRLHEAAEELGLVARVHAYGGSELLGPSIRGAIGQVLVHLADDIVASVRHGREEGDRTPLRVSLALQSAEGRAVIKISDDAPRLHDGSVLGDVDQLAVFTGLRRARPLLHQIQGLLRMQPSDEPDVRFVLSVPLDLDRPCYAVFTLEQATVAVPAALVDEVIDASGLLYDTDESGESVDHGGHGVPIADLAQFVAAVRPAAQSSPCIAVLGLVEKRVGLGCEHDRTVVVADELLDPPTGWENVAYAGLEFEDEVLPVLDLRRLLALRFRSAREHDLAGAHVDPLMDAFEPIDEEEPAGNAASPQPASVAPVDAAPSKERPALRQVLLVNQSEFRRRDLSRTLEQVGLSVKIADDLVVAAERLERGDIDLLVTDLRLGQEGGESFHSLREKHPGLHIVLTSSVAQQYARELARTTGADHCWLDPYRASDLRQIIAKLAHA